VRDQSGAGAEPTTGRGSDSFLHPLALSMLAAAAVVSVSFLAAAGRDGTFAIDLRRAFLPAAHQVLHGHTPYPRVSQLSAAEQTGYVYPPLSAVILAPLSWIPSLVVALVVVCLAAAAIAATLWLLDVRDARCYAVAFLWGPTLAALQTANLTPFLALAAAAVWRFRARSQGGWAMAAALAPKVFLWPLAAWAIAAGRIRTAVTGVAGAVALTLASWGAIGFAGLETYPHLLRRLQALEERDAYTIFALARALGAGHGGARAVWLAAGVATLAACLVFARRRDERRAFALAVAASLLLTPIVWLHYFVLLLVPLAIARPSLDWSWFLPIALIGGSGTGNGGTARTILVLGTGAVVVAAALFPTAPGYVLARRRTTSDESL